MNNEDYSTIIASLTENIGAVGRLENKPEPARATRVASKVPKNRQSTKLKKTASTYRTPKRTESTRPSKYL